MGGHLLVLLLGDIPFLVVKAVTTNCQYKRGDFGAHFRVKKIVVVEISARAIIQAKYCVCWGPLQTHKDTIMRI